jgi:hypothetical protein
MSEDGAESTPELSPDQKVEQLIDKGVDLIKAGKYQDAIEGMRSPETAKAAGVHWKQTPERYVVERTPTPKEAKILADLVAKSSIVFSDWMQISNIATYGPEITGNPDPVQIPDVLWHNIALTHAEEWHHVLSNLRGGKPIAGGDNIETDAALFLYKKGVPLTDEFKDRYDRRKALGEPEQPKSEEQIDPSQELNRAERGEKADELNKRVQAWADRMRLDSTAGNKAPTLNHKIIEKDGSKYIISHSQRIYDRRKPDTITSTEIELYNAQRHMKLNIESTNSVAMMTASGTEGFDGSFTTADVMPDEVRPQENKLVNIQANNELAYHDAKRIIDELTAE